MTTIKNILDEYLPPLLSRSMSAQTGGIRKNIKGLLSEVSSNPSKTILPIFISLYFISIYFVYSIGFINVGLVAVLLITGAAVYTFQVYITDANTDNVVPLIVLSIIAMNDVFYGVLFSGSVMLLYTAKISLESKIIEYMLFFVGLLGHLLLSAVILYMVSSIQIVLLYSLAVLLVVLFTGIDIFRIARSNTKDL